ncbi:glycosyltransferase family 117 protein [Roseivirga spongicola]|uniref:glycosyltransferase family 117 protein n=1 Tax=Roseivirga spongicola TaxID=333140 RepID=UPI002AC96A8C|nr:DUF2723 domain-containing protein [Roseivirga spongicola]WPZ12112.1 DUF2723 domain-containing protein [Roseivirga spongicola]
MTDFKKTNNLVGWGVFLVSLITYVLTVERTASFWDCGEFIAIAYKLEVSHPPGAPLFMLIGRLFSFLSFGDVTRVAYWVNMASVLSSAFTILFLYWTIVMLGRKIISAKIGKETPTQKLLLLGSGAIGALAFSFTDSFWFSAVEGEVYAMSSFFTAVVFWAILKWELVDDESRANKWLLFIAYMIGLSTGVHLQVLVTLPALGLVYYFKKYKKPTWTGGILALAFSLFLVLFINSFIIPGLPSIAGKFEITFVNAFGLPFGSGALFLTIIVIALIIFGLRYTVKKEMVNLNTLILSMAFVLIGYTCYAVILVRSRADPPIDQNNPEDVMTFVSYLKREQYGSRPLVHGQYFNAPITDYVEGAPVYYKAEDGYKISDYKMDYEYDPAYTTLLPRMWSSAPGHDRKYMEVTGVTPGEIPSFGDNLRFMFRHQIGHMYLRYFMFNFAGRESDIQDADWLSPVSSNKGVPETIINNKGRNQYYMIPLILGLVGFFFQFNRDPKGFSATLMLFILTGVALVVYLNSPPIEPRERDYIYAGSYYAFAIWIGLSMLAIGGALAKRGKALAIGTLALGAIAPIILAAENWDDHDRSNRYFSVDSARNFLASVAPNAILFTGGDNDTFPLWYIQEVEGFRTDVRVVVLSYYATDWYIEQTATKMNESEAFPYSLTIDNYRQGTNDVLYVNELPQFAGQAIDLKEYIDVVRRDVPQFKRTFASGAEVMLIPAETLTMPIDTAAVLEKGLVPESLEPYLVDRMYFDFKRNSQGEVASRTVDKGQMMLFDLIAQNNWERPIYFNYTSVNALNWEAEPYLVQEGMAYRLLPVQKPQNMRDLVNTDLMYDNLMNKMQFRGLDDPSANLNEDYRGFVQNHRSMITTLAEGLIIEGDSARAKEVLDFGMEKMPVEAVPYDVSTVGFVEGYFKIGEDETALKMAMEMAEQFNSELTYLQNKMRYNDFSFRSKSQGLRYIQLLLEEFGKTDEATKVGDMLQEQQVRMQIDRSTF